jgi:hypothetical protein
MCDLRLFLVFAGHSQHQQFNQKQARPCVCCVAFQRLRTLICVFFVEYHFNIALSLLILIVLESVGFYIPLLRLQLSDCSRHLRQSQFSDPATFIRLIYIHSILPVRGSLNMSGGVRNLRAMFEIKDESSISPPDRGRSPAGSIGMAPCRKQRWQLELAAGSISS